MESTKKYHIEKNTVQETLIIPLFARKICAEKFPQAHDKVLRKFCADENCENQFLICNLEALL